MSKASTSHSPNQNMGQKIAAAGISAAVAMLFLVLALPLGRSPRASTSTAEEAKSQRPLTPQVEDDRVLGAVEELARSGRQEPQEVLRALEPLIQLLTQSAPQETTQALERWLAGVQTPTHAQAPLDGR